jgi:DNA primase
MKVWDPNALGLQIIKVTGVEAKLRCPFHLDHEPSARFNLSNGLFHCFGCGYSTNAYHLAKEFGGTLLKIDLALIPHQDEDDREWRQLLYSKLATRNTYLGVRGVTVEQVKKFKIMAHKDGVLFPVFDKSGLAVGVQERKYTGEPKYILHGSRTPVWPMANLKYEHLLLVEGVFGVLRADKYGFKAVCTMGASAIPPAAKILEGHSVRILFDNDLAGYLGAYSFMKLHNNSEVSLPGGEADEMKYGEMAFAASKLATRDVIGYATKTGNKALLNAIKLKEEQNGKKKTYWKLKGSTSRKTR